MLSASERVPHEGLALLLVDQDSKAMAAAHVFSMVVVGCVSLGHGEAGSSDTVGRVHDRGEAVSITFKEAEQRRLPVVLAEAFEELGVGEDVAPALAHGGRAGERGRLRRETDEDLGKEIVVAEHLGHGAPQLPAVHARRAGNGAGPLDLGNLSRTHQHESLMSLIIHPFLSPTKLHYFKLLACKNYSSAVGLSLLLLLLLLVMIYT